MERKEGEEEEGKEKPGREYLKEIPDELGEGEYEWEKKERLSRKKNIFIRGVRTIGKGIKEELTRPIGGGLVVELESLGNKIEITKKRMELEKMRIRVEDDFTEREKEVREWLRKLEKQEKAQGVRVKLGYLKAQVEGDWYEWDDRKGMLIKQRAEN
ncbi:hypothetical protein TSAR_005517 [Trichomalopsis sarcophagae]|uniref:Uncharacterized protein n=1 Tax=Trichomalopsis sarcophagae TaxID=543379 RepID=A0A232EHU1_9HYME|nr:hypothetical protein TSAR_005517 [Trichomalopsis sarcophagae]